jgi:hypothetical protein
MSNKPAVSPFKDESAPPKPWATEPSSVAPPNGTHLTNGDAFAAKAVNSQPVRSLPPVDDRAVEAELANIEAKENNNLSQIGDAKARAQYKRQGKKREGEVNRTDLPKQKVRGVARIAHPPNNPPSCSHRVETPNGNDQTPRKGSFDTDRGRQGYLPEVPRK